MQLTLRDICKTYPNGVHALDKVSLTIPVGMYGLLGPNGAGKSTLMRILATLQEADGGSAMLGELDVLRCKDEVRKTLGYLPQEFGVYPHASAEALLDYFAVLEGIGGRGERRDLVESLLRQVNLWDVRRQKLGGYSGGMRQRFGVAVALLGDPKLLIVDEPTVGLDPEERVRFRHLLAELAGERLVILSTHIVSDIEAGAGTLAVMAGGRLRFHGTPEALMAEAEGHVWHMTIAADQLADARTRLRISRAQRRAHGVELRVVGEQAPSADAVAVAPDLEDAYLWLLHREGARS